MSIFPIKMFLAADGSEEAELAARAATDLTAKTGSELHVVHVLIFPREGEHDSGVSVEGLERAEEMARGGSSPGWVSR